MAGLHHNCSLYFCFLLNHFHVNVFIVCTVLTYGLYRGELQNSETDHSPDVVLIFLRVTHTSCFCYVLFPDDVPRTLANSIATLKPRLSDFIEPDFGLLDHLLSMEVLTRREFEDVRSERRGAWRRNAAVLDLLASEDQCDKFLTALQLTGQQHVVNFITENGGQNDNEITAHSQNVKNDIRHVGHPSGRPPSDFSSAGHFPAQWCRSRWGEGAIAPNKKYRRESIFLFEYDNLPGKPPSPPKCKKIKFGV